MPLRSLQTRGIIAAVATTAPDAAAEGITFGRIEFIQSPFCLRLPLSNVPPTAES